MSKKFKKIAINNWKQFENIEIDFHPKLTILTGANGAGKTTIVKLLARHFGWGYSEIATPFKKADGEYSYLTRATNKLKLLFSSPLKLFESIKNEGNEIGIISYENELISKLMAPQETGPSYQIEITGQQQVLGMHIPAHRNQFIYQQVTQIPTRARTAAEAYNQIYSNTMNFTISGSGSQTAYHIKESLISWALFGHGNKIIAPNEVAIKLFNDFQNTLKIVLPSTLGFKEFSIRNSDVVLVCETGEFLIDACSGGITTIIDLCWQIFNYKGIHQNFVVLIDEAENHLHASMQRNLMPSLIKAFPEAQFIITTHSPLIIGSVRDSNVYALSYTNDRVNSELLDLENKASTASEILRDVLGLNLTIPVWAEMEVTEIVNRNSNSGLTEESIKQLKQDLKEKSLEHFLPMALNDYLKKQIG